MPFNKESIKDWELFNATPLTVKGGGITVTVYIHNNFTGTYNNEFVFSLISALLLAFRRTGQTCTGCFVNCKISSFRQSPGTRERWFLLTVETEVNGDSKSTNGRGPSLVPRWARRAGTRDFYPAFAALVNPVQNIFAQPYTISIYVHPCLDSRAGPPVSECVSPLGTQGKQFALSHILYITNITPASFSFIC